MCITSENIDDLDDDYDGEINCSFSESIHDFSQIVITNNRDANKYMGVKENQENWIPPSSKSRLRDIDDKVYEDMDDSKGIPKIYDSQTKMKMDLDFDFDEDPYLRNDKLKNDFNRVHNMSFGECLKNNSIIKDLNILKFEGEEAYINIEKSCQNFSKNKPILVKDSRHINQK